MAYVQQDGFDFLEDMQGKPTFLVLKGRDLKHELEYLIQKKIPAIYITEFDSESITNLNFLKELTFIEKINFNGINIDYSPLYYLKNLKYVIISIKNKKQYLDISKFPKLEYLSIDWYPQFSDLTNNTALKHLTIWKYKPKSKSLSDLKLPQGLKSLEITESNIMDLKGLNLDNLERFEAHHCNQMLNFHGVNEISKNLKTLIFDYCRKLSDYDELAYCTRLNKLILGDCGDIKTLSWLKHLKKLNHFSFWGTTVLDGDISPCLGIDFVTFKDSKHYNRKYSEFLR